VRATIVLLLGLSVVASLMTSPFGLKRLLFNLYPLTKERIASTAARDHAFSVEGLYILEEQVFREVGLRRPKEGRWDLFFLTFVLVLLLLLSLCLGLLALVIAMSWDLTLEVIRTLRPTSTCPFRKFTGSSMPCPRASPLSRSLSFSGGLLLLCGGGKGPRVLDERSSY
jgi:hypothetical protein